MNGDTYKRKAHEADHPTRSHRRAPRSHLPASTRPHKARSRSGVADASIRYLTNANAKNDGLLSMTNGAITNSRFGIYGTEDLGGGLKAVFNLESGVNLQNGASPTAAACSTAQRTSACRPYGTVTLGRQKTPLFDLLSDTYDPLTVGNYLENAWLPVALGGGLYADNQIKYTGKFDGLTAKAMYSTGTNYESTGAGGFGPDPGFARQGQCVGRVAVVRDASASRPARSRTATTRRASRRSTTRTSYAFSKAKIYAGYLRSKDDTGFVDSLLAQQTIPVAKGTGRIDDGPFAGVSWQVSAPLTLTARSTTTTCATR